MSHLQEIYEAAYKDEIQKIALFEKRKKKKALEHEAQSAYDKIVDKSYDEFEKEMKPYEDQENLHRRVGLTGLALGSLAALPKGRLRKTRGALGSLIGGYVLGSSAGEAIRIVDPKYAKASDIASDKLFKADERAIKAYDKIMSRKI